MELFDDEFKEGSKRFKDAAPEAVEAYKNYQKVMLEKSPFGGKMNELILLAASCAIQCSYCIKTHAKRAKMAGATDQEIAAIINLAASVKQGATISYGVNALPD